MKVAVCSDLHLEFGTISLDNTENADVLVLSGDICVANDLGEYDAHNIMGENTRSNRYHKFFQECSERFPHVLYIMGNHEHYHGDFALSGAVIRNRLAHLRNFHFLDKEVFQLDDVTFIGGTLWTDMNKEDSLTLLHMKSMMNDFRIVDNSNRKTMFRVPLYKVDGNGQKMVQIVNGIQSLVEDGFEMHERVSKFSPEDSVEDHKKMMDYIQLMVEGKYDQKFVVCGHHSPSKLSTHPRYAKDTIMNGGYSSDLSEFILDHPQIKLWTHGHTHEDFDYMIGSTRIVCNPRGYDGHEIRASRFELKFVEI